VNRAVACGAFVLKVERELSSLRFHLHDLRTGQKLTFANWEALEQHVEKHAQQGLR